MRATIYMVRIMSTRGAARTAVSSTHSLEPLASAGMTHVHTRGKTSKKAPDCKTKARREVKHHCCIQNWIIKTFYFIVKCSPGLGLQSGALLDVSPLVCICALPAPEVAPSNGAMCDVNIDVKALSLYCIV